MSGGSVAAPVEVEYLREEKREHKAMESTLSGLCLPKFTVTHLSKAFDDNHSVGSGKSDQSLITRIFFENAEDKVTAPIGDPVLSGEYG
jgi:hypothetical protein